MTNAQSASPEKQRIRVGRRRRRHRKGQLKRWLGPASALVSLGALAFAVWFFLGPGLGRLLQPAAGVVSDPPPAPITTAAPAAEPAASPVVSPRMPAMAEGGDATSPPPPLHLPADDAPHDASTEWWYYNGHLSGPNGQRYSFHLAVFLRDGMVRHTVFHASLNEYRRGNRFTHQVRTAGVPRGDAPEGFSFAFEDWQVSGVGGAHALRFGSDEFSLELTLVHLQAPVLHNLPGARTFGFIPLGAAGGSYYYSRPRMQARGILSITGAGRVPVTGEAWFDHQWGDFEASRLAWDWFALQLDDGAALMIYQLYDEAGALLSRFGTYTGPDGHSVALGPDDIALEPLGGWKSPESGVVYPEQWQVGIPQGRFRLTAQRQESEFNGLESSFAHYWEGAVTIEGTQGGVGFVEMSGYDHVPSVQPTGAPAPGT